MTAVLKTNPRPIERETLAKIATRMLREVILSGELAEGEQLRQDALAAQYGISRIPLREAASRKASTPRTAGPNPISTASRE